MALNEAYRYLPGYGPGIALVSVLVKCSVGLQALASCVRESLPSDVLGLGFDNAVERKIAVLEILEQYRGVLRQDVTILCKLNALYTYSQFYSNARLCFNFRTSNSVFDFGCAPDFSRRWRYSRQLLFNPSSMDTRGS